MGLELRSVGITLRDQRLIAPFDLTVHPQEIVTLTGPSGSGKSSLLSFIAGDLLPPLAGTGNIHLGGVAMTQLPPQQRRIGRLFQDDLLFPHLSVGDNLLFGMPRGERGARHHRMLQSLSSVGLEGFERRDPASLSGGQRQRVSLIRALLAEPRAILLDEPFNKLDETLRQSMRELTYAHIRSASIPCLLVTHDRADVPAGGRVLHITSDGEVHNV